ncbi:MAG TPA: hypothetical protein VMH84_16885 [Xanthobacteraceae bacterium]|nr:hypothetical protein [Xanthobacteraceae bacterium]
MTDDEITARMLEILYEHRHDSVADLDKVLKPQFPDVAENVLQSLLSRMEQRRMVDRTATIGGLGYGTISNHGIDIVTGKVNAQLPIKINVAGSSRSGDFDYEEIVTLQAPPDVGGASTLAPAQWQNISCGRQCASSRSGSDTYNEWPR